MTKFAGCGCRQISSGTPYGRFAQMLLLTAQRRDEVAGMRRSELKGTDLWTISRERMKGGVPHDVPLASQAARVLEGIPRVHGSDYVFTLSGDGPITGYSEAKRRLDGKILEIAREDARGRGEAPPEAIPRWTFHDLRRTAASGMAQLGTPVHVIEAVLAHRGGEISGVAGIYNKWNYLPEKSKALAAWARYLESLVSGEPASNVVELHSA